MCSLESDQEANPNNQDHRAMLGGHIQTWELLHAQTNGCTLFNNHIQLFSNFVCWLGTSTYPLNQDACLY